MDFGKALKSVRKELKISRVELAKRSDLSVTALYNILSFPSKETITKLCKSLSIPVSYLMLYSLTEEDVPEERREFFRFAVEPLKAFLMGK